MKSPPAESAPSWHTLPTEAVFSRLTTTSGGLSSMEADRRLAVCGPNELEPPHRVSPWGLFCEQFKNVLIVILLVATALSAFLGHGIEAVAIAVIVLFAVLLGFVQEFRADRAIEALRRMAAPTAAKRRAIETGERAAREILAGR